MFLHELENGTTNFTSYLFFIVYNVMGPSFDKIFTITSEIKTCELSRLDSLNTLKINLLICELIIICVIFLSLGIYLILIDKHLNLI